MARQYVSFREYVSEVLKTDRYEAGEDLDCVVAVAQSLPGCMTQGRSLDKVDPIVKT